MQDNDQAFEALLAQVTPAERSALTAFLDTWLSTTEVMEATGLKSRQSVIGQWELPRIALSGGNAFFPKSAVDRLAAKLKAQGGVRRGRKKQITP